MKLEIKRNEISDNPYTFLRRAGYGFIRDRRSNQESLVRRLGGGFYPRFHIYVDEDESRIVFNLHLDHKEASYAGAHKHNAEYDGDLVQREIMRLKNWVNNSKERKIVKKDNKEEKKSWIKRLFS
ncbi:hypothetical protein K8R62_00530 [bacterium]|nr:hypothetical protein [bacterium]